MTETQHSRGRFSSCCGYAFKQTHSWPRVCTACGNEFWENALPVAIVLQPVIRKDHAIGIVVIRRSIAPCIGQIALPGGYQEVENWRVAGARELQEEGVGEIHPNDLTPFKPYPFESSTTNRQIMFFCLAKPIMLCDLKPFVPNNEVSERIIIYKPIECCFYTHTEAIKHFFATYVSLQDFSDPA